MSVFAIRRSPARAAAPLLRVRIARACMSSPAAAPAPPCSPARAAGCPPASPAASCSPTPVGNDPAVRVGREVHHPLGGFLLLLRRQVIARKIIPMRRIRTPCPPAVRLSVPRACGVPSLKKSSSRPPDGAAMTSASNCGGHVKLANSSSRTQGTARFYPSMHPDARDLKRGAVDTGRAPPSNGVVNLRHQM